VDGSAILANFTKILKLVQKGLAGSPAIPMFAAPKRGTRVSGEATYPSRDNRIFFMSRIKTHVKKGDQVEIIAGNHKGKRGTVLLVNAEKGKVTVEGGRPIIKAVKPTEAEPNGGLKTIDGTVHISNVKKVG
jgi:large subunit ribosomal protein L24